MYKELQDLVRKITNDSGLTGEARELLLKELESHMYEQVHDLELKGWNKTRILEHITQKFGPSEQLGRELALVHKSTFLYSIFHFSSITLSIMFKHTQKILSVFLLLVALYLNNTFFSQTTFKMLADCIDNFETAAALAPSNFEKDETGRYLFTVPESDAGNMFTGAPAKEGCNNYEKVDIGGGALANVDIDEDGSLTPKEIYINGSVGQLNTYMDLLIDNLYPLLITLLALLDTLVLYCIISAWMPTKMKN